MSDDLPPRNAEVLDEGVDEVNGTGARQGLLVLLALVVVVGIVVAVMLGGRSKASLDPVPSPASATTVTGSPSAVEYTVDAPDPSATEYSVAPDAEPVPLMISTDGKVISMGDFIGFAVQVCVPEASTRSVRISPHSWTLAETSGASREYSSVTTGLADGLYAPGSCASGIVSFAVQSLKGPYYLQFVGQRTFWAFVIVVG